MLHDLPHDIAAMVLDEFCELSFGRQLCALDVAYCNHSFRSDWLLLLAQLPPIEESDVKQSLQTFLLWVECRKVRVKGLWLDLALVNELDGVLPTSISCVQALTLTNDDEYNENALGIMQFMQVLPSLTSLRCEGYDFTNAQLLQVQHWLQVPLKILRLKGLSNDLRDGIVALVSRFSPTLEVLECDSLGDLTLQLITPCCRNLTRIASTMSYMKDNSYLLGFCAANPNLQVVDFSYAPGETESGAWINSKHFTDEFVEQLSAHCPNLQDIIFDMCHDNMECTVLPVVLGNCKDLQRIIILDTLLTFHCDSQTGSRYCEVNWIGNVWIDRTEKSIIALINSIPVPIHRFGGGFKVEADDEDEGYENEEKGIISAWVNGRVCEVLAKHSGNTLRHVALYLSDAICTADIHFLLSRCPNLTNLSLTGAGATQATVVDQSVIKELHRYCPHLVDIKLSSCANSVPAAAVVEMLTSFRGNDMSEIAFDGCKLLTNAVLDKIQELFPELQCLSVRSSTLMTKEKVLQYLIESARTLRSFCPPSKKMVNWLNNKLLAAIGVNRVDIVAE